ncbi:MAG: hypothetical protein JWM21_2651 [Acidobacteria bacterium]|nr:hypothetical protein [Acidobacteriota bacterium]
MRKQRSFLIFALSAIWVFAVAERLLSSRATTANSSLSAAPQRTNSTRSRAAEYGPPVELAHLRDPAITESSGIVASRTAPGLYWTHNDSGDGPFIYAFDGQGKSRGVWRVAGAGARDWEDIAAGPGPVRNRSYLYIGDIGDNSSVRSTIVVYRIPEPTVTADDVRSTKSRPRSTETADSIQLRYPDGKRDAETLMVHPFSGDLYVITKELWGKASVYKAAAPLDTVKTITMVRVGGLNIPGLLGGFVTGGDISPDGSRVALCDYLHGYEILLGSANAFDAIWKQPIKVIELGQRRQGEAVCYRLDGKALLTTSEGPSSPLTEVVRR